MLTSRRPFATSSSKLPGKSATVSSDLASKVPLHVGRQPGGAIQSVACVVVGAGYAIFQKAKKRSSRHGSGSTSRRLLRKTQDDRLTAQLTAPVGQVLIGVRKAGALLQDLWFHTSPEEWRPAALRGNWAPVRKESLRLETQLLDGAIPCDLPAGRFVRNGPNPRWVRPGMAEYHPFEGDGMLHVFEFGQTSGAAAPVAHYGNRWLRTAKWHVEDAAQMPLMSGMVDDNLVRVVINMTLNLSSFFAALPAILANSSSVWAVGGSYVTNTNVIAHGGETLALGECGSPVTVDLENLETTGTMDTGGSFNAHPKICPSTGELIWCGYQPDGLDYGVWDAEGKSVHFTTVPLTHSIMMHDMAVTQRYTLFLDCPLRFQTLYSMSKGRPFLSFDPSEPMRFGVLPRHGHGDEVVWVEVPGPGKMVFHVLNAFEDDTGEIVVIGCAAHELNLMQVHDIPFEKVRLTEWRIDSSQSTCRERVLSSHPCEFPRINDNYTGLKSRYGYAAIFADAKDCRVGPLFQGFMKHDLQAKKTQVYKLGRKQFCSEPVFVPGKDCNGEDDGYIMLYMHDEDKDESQIFIYDAQKEAEQPICRLALPERVPYGFHAAWITSIDE